MAYNFHSTLAARKGVIIDKPKVLVVTGDSGSGGLVTALQTQLPDWLIIGAGRGGANASQIAGMYSGTGLFTGYRTIIWDLSNDSLANNQAAYPQMWNGFARNDGQILFIEPGVSGDLGDPNGTPVTHMTLSEPTTRDTSYIQPRDFIRNTYPNNHVEIYDAMLAAHDGSAGDLADVDAGIFPRSLREWESATSTYSSVHLSTTGYGVVAAQAVAKMTAAGWL